MTWSEVQRVHDRYVDEVEYMWGCRQHYFEHIVVCLKDLDGRKKALKFCSQYVMKALNSHSVSGSNRNDLSLAIIQWWERDILVMVLMWVSKVSCLSAGSQDCVCEMMDVLDYCHL